MLVAAPLLLALWAAPAAPAPLLAKDPVRALRVWIARRERVRRAFDQEAERELRELLGDLRVLALGEPERDREIDLALVDLAAHDWLPRPERRAARRAGTRDGLICALALERLSKNLDRDHDGDMAAWLADEVLARPREQVRRRLAAADVFRGRYVDESLTALLAAARGEHPDLCETAMRSLAGWPEPRVHLFFLEQLERDAVPVAVALEHFEEARPSLGTQALDMLRSYVGRLYVSSDWRDAARARALLPILDVQRAAPILIESLAIWTERVEAGEGSKRIQHEIVRELRRVSGRSIGAHPERWAMWWKAVREGRVDTVEDTLEQGGSVTQASFFGLNPVTDRVIFVIDRSGSMETTFGTGGRSRYDEAVEQMLTFVERMGAGTRFSVTLFSHDGQRWKSELVRANDSNLNGARRWLQSKRPDGGTMLRAGIDTALELDRTGRIDLERVEADTVIVLCDGATSEGPAWVQPWLERANEEAQLVFHCVQIGRFGDGTLEALAARTGGDFVTIDG